MDQVVQMRMRMKMVEISKKAKLSSDSSANHETLEDKHDEINREHESVENQYLSYPNPHMSADGVEHKFPQADSKYSTEPSQNSFENIWRDDTAKQEKETR